MTQLHGRTVEEFKAGFTGEVLLPSDSPYDSARRVWNGMIDSAPR